MCLERGDQAMLFLNRRGYAGFVACRSCGTVIGCPHCNVSLSLHKRYGRRKAGVSLLRLYTAKSTPLSVLHFSFYRKFSGGDTAGSKPGAAYVSEGTYFAYGCRYDQRKDGHHKILETFAKGGADILVGTQMIVKGHDFADVTLVGALAADLSLHMSDYRAAERTFQLLTQAAGRAGRGEKRKCRDPDL